MSLVSEMNEPSEHYRPLLQLVLCRLREFYREPEAVFWVYGFPIVMIVVLGIAFRSQPGREVRVDFRSGSAATPSESWLAEKFPAKVEGSADPSMSENQPPTIDFVTAIHDEETCRVRLRSGKTDLVVVAQGTPESPQYEYVYDPTRPESLAARDAVDDMLQRACGRAPAAITSDLHVKDVGSRYIDRLVPGLLGMSLMGGGLWGVGFATVDMRIRKLLKRFLATPMRRGDFLAGIMLSRMIFLVPEVLVLLIFSRIAFGVEIRGSLLSLLVLILLGASTFAGIGLLVASRAKTTEAVSGLMNLIMLPMWLLSGVFFSSERFPDLAQPFIKALPLTAMVDSLRAVSIEGAGLADLGTQIAILSAWCVVSFVIALKIFRWS